jgi:hypothetical protein
VADIANVERAQRLDLIAMLNRPRLDRLSPRDFAALITSIRVWRRVRDLAAV